MAKIKKRLLACLLLTVFCFSPIKIFPAKNNLEAVLVLDAKNESVLPKRFHYGSAHVIGSGQFSENQLKCVLELINQPIYIIDLRNESHAFINGNAVSWYVKQNRSNNHFVTIQVQSDESNQIDSLKKTGQVAVYQIINKSGLGEIIEAKPLSFLIEQVNSEAEIAKKFGLNYARFYVNDHEAPTPDQVDKFVALIKSLPKDQMFYIHCSGGAGRTTTFMIMLDMMRNADKTSLHDILERQYQLGGKDLFHLPPKDSNKYENAKSRKEFLEKFYHYCLHNKNSFTISWSDWLKST